MSSRLAWSPLPALAVALGLLWFVPGCLAAGPIKAGRYAGPSIAFNVGDNGRAFVSNPHIVFQGSQIDAPCASLPWDRADGGGPMTLATPRWATGRRSISVRTAPFSFRPPSTSRRGPAPMHRPACACGADSSRLVCGPSARFGFPDSGRGRWRRAYDGAPFAPGLRASATAPSVPVRRRRRRRSSTTGSAASIGRPTCMTPTCAMSLRAARVMAALSTAAIAAPGGAGS